MPLPCGALLLLELLLFRNLFIVGRMRPKGLDEEAKKTATISSGHAVQSWKINGLWHKCTKSQATGAVWDELGAQDSGPPSVIVFCNRGARVRAESPARLTSCCCHSAHLVFRV